MQVAAQHHAIAHTLPHAYYANPQSFPEGTLEHLLRGEGDPNDAAHQHAVVSHHSLLPCEATGISLATSTTRIRNAIKQSLLQAVASYSCWTILCLS